MLEINNFMNKYDVCVIGGGPSGYAAAMRALDFGKSTILIEKHKLGGAGVFNGALASKTMWEISHDILSEKNQSEKFGTSFEVPSYKAIIKEVREAEMERSNQMLNHVLQLEKHINYSKLKFIEGSASLKNQNEVLISMANGINEVILSDNIILATGSRPRYLNNIAIDEKIIVTSDGINNFEDFPESLVILGAGVIGCEYAAMFSNFGKTRVHLISKDDRILPFEDTDISAVLEENFKKNGITIHKNAQLKSMKVVGGKVHYELCFPDNHCEIFEVEKALISVGRVPNIETLGLENVGIVLNKRGFIEDDNTKTSISNIYAVGDLTADIALVNVGELEGRHAVEIMYNNEIKKLRYDNISTIMFLNPETASVGLNETQAIAKGLNFRVATVQYDAISRAIAMRNTQGFFKILVTDDAEMRVLGMRALGEHASSAIQAVALLMEFDKGIETLAEMIHPHPSIIEGVQECLRVLLKKSIYKPIVFAKHIQIKEYRNGNYIL